MDSHKTYTVKLRAPASVTMIRRVRAENLDDAVADAVNAATNCDDGDWEIRTVDTSEIEVMDAGEED